MAKSRMNKGQQDMSNNTVITIGLDLGYGVVKAVTNDSTFAFPSVMGHARQLKFQQNEIAQKYPGDQLTDDEGKWFVGDLALSQVPAGELLRLRGRTADEKNMGNNFRVRLAKAALAKLMPGIYGGDVIHVNLAVGLPVDHMADAGELKSALLGQHVVRTDSTDFIANVASVMVMPQAYGAIYSQMLTPTGEINPHHTAMRTGVVDVGTFTVDIALDDDGEFISAQSGSVESGVHTAQERIASLLESDWREKASYKVVERVLRTGTFTASGKPVDYSDAVEEALAPMRDATLGIMGQLWQRAVNIDVIYLTGGGAELVYEQVADAYPQTKLTQQAQFANARGYLYFANFKANQG